MSQTPRRAVAGGGGALAGKSVLITGGQPHPIVPAGGRQRSAANVAPSSLAAAPDSAANWVKVNGRYNYRGPETSAEGKR
jgi:hypothetical protein